MPQRLPSSFRVLAVAASLVAGLIACVPQFADDLSLVRTARVVAVRAVPAEAKPGTKVELTALVASPVQQPSDAANLEWAMCLARKPLTELGPVAQECIDAFGAGGELFQRLGRGPAVSGAVPADACARFGPLSAAAGPGGVATRPVDPDLSGGYHQPIVVGSELGAVLASVRLSCGVVGLPNAEAVRFTQGYRPNENPEVDRLELVTANGAQPIAPGVAESGISIRAGTRVDLRAVWSTCPREAVCGDAMCTSGENQSNCPADCRTNPRGCTGAESYLSPNPETRSVAGRREGMSVAWYANAGVFTEEQTGRTETEPDAADSSNSWRAPSDAGLVRLWIVLRDDRGGIGWGEYLVRVEP